MQSINFNVQALRALAAYGVVIHHTLFTLREYVAPDRFKADIKTGASGVPIFFVVSGFIMMFISHMSPQTPREFLRNRIARVAPIYWLLTVAAVIAIFAGGAVFGQRSVDSRSILTSLMFLPDLRDGGLVGPVIYVGWSLNYEMMFYAIFAACLLLNGTIKRLFALNFTILALWVAGTTVENAYLGYWGSDIILAFAGGSIIWQLPTLPRLPALAMLAASLAVLPMTDIFPAINAMAHGSLVTIAGGSALYMRRSH